MGFTTSTTSPNVKIIGANTSPTITHITIAAADTEQSLVLASNVKSFMVQHQGTGLIKFRYATGGDHVRLYCGTSFKDNNFYESQTIFFESSNAGDIIAVVQYT